MQIEKGSFVWDVEKEQANLRKHNIDFTTAAEVFRDPAVRIFADAKHSAKEERLFAIGKVCNKVITVRFIYRDKKIRIFGAGYWRRGKWNYEKETR